MCPQTRYMKSDSWLDDHYAMGFKNHRPISVLPNLTDDELLGLWPKPVAIMCVRRPSFTSLISFL